MLVNGLPSDCISAEDRGLSYGDGVFRTLRTRNAEPLNWRRHFAKLRHDCAALGLDCPDQNILLSEIRQLSGSQAEAITKIVITRGRGQRGYAAPTIAGHTRIVDCQPLPQYPAELYTAGIQTQVCSIKLGHQPALAGIKHLNRLENVLAATECQEAGLPEGLLEDEQGMVISGTRSNLFLVRNGIIFTPELSLCGVAGVQRERVLDWADKHDTDCKIGRLQIADLLAADEVFLVNSLFRLWSIREFPGYLRTEHPFATRIRNWLDEDEA
ncbi:MAG: aminodeoxychorismate lyase [Sideroxydans sp.]|jgi:4-amino-4-deoxychorismate lyase